MLKIFFAIEISLRRSDYFNRESLDRLHHTDYKWKFNVFLKIGLTGKYFSVEIEEEMKGEGERESPTHTYARAVDLLSVKCLSRG